MKSTDRQGVHQARRGVVLGLVILVGVVVLVLGIAMISTSGGLLLTGVDSKQRIKARIAAETQATLQIASAMEMAARIFGTDSTLPGRSLALLPTGDGMQGASVVEQIGRKGQSLPQELITTGPFKGLKGLKIGYNIRSTGLAPGGAKGQVDVELKIYQVPIFQFGVFYQGNLEITPGLSMTVLGPVHTNGMALFRAPSFVPDDALQFQGPVTATGKIYHWMGAGSLRYWNTPEDSQSVTLPSLATTIREATINEVPPEINLAHNVMWGVDSLKLPIETSDPRQLIMPKTGTEPEGLARQKFANKASAASRWINPGNGSGRPTWITGNGLNNAPRVFWDRREQAWVRYWNFDVLKLIASGNKDSVFYIADTFNFGEDLGKAKKQTINAFRIINASKLPRNMSIASPNPIYILGDFNVGPTPGCYDRSLASAPAGGDYCNAMIASDAITLLSPKWSNYKRGNTTGADERSGTLDQGSENPMWTMDGSSPEPTKGVPSDTLLPTTDARGPFGGTVRVNAALMTGNKAAPISVLPPNNYDNGVFEGGYEGGWHNTIRFLEDLRNGAVVEFKGSFVCMWESSARGLNKTGKVIRTLPGGYYLPPKRVWGFDPRFKNLSNMPPATPFLATKPLTTWAERR
ncbi:MAG: hypothetical protein RL173_3710 [Fibrobacterota bacterium]|jgi:hypothetical protein